MSWEWTSVKYELGTDDIKYELTSVKHELSGCSQDALGSSRPRAFPGPRQNSIWTAPPKPLEFVLQIVIKMIVFVSRQASGSFGAVPGRRADRANLLFPNETHIFL